MKKALIISSIVALTLAACSPATSTDISEAQNRIAPLASIKADQEAVFEEVAKYGNNCKVGTMHWIRKSDAFEMNMNAVICENVPTVSLQYQVGKHSESVAHIGYKVDPEKVVEGLKSYNATREKELEDKLREEKEKLLEEARQSALSKLTDVEKAALGL